MTEATPETASVPSNWPARVAQGRMGPRDRPARVGRPPVLGRARGVNPDEPDEATKVLPSILLLPNLQVAEGFLGAGPGPSGRASRRAAARAARTRRVARELRPPSGAPSPPQPLAADPRVRTRHRRRRRHWMRRSMPWAGRPPGASATRSLCRAASTIWRQRPSFRRAGPTSSCPRRHERPRLARPGPAGRQPRRAGRADDHPRGAPA